MFPVVLNVPVVIDNINAAGQKTERHKPSCQQKKTVCIEEFSCKVRTGPPIDDEEDYSFSTWAGVLPLETVAQLPLNDPRLDASREVPRYVREYSRK